jgi:hypothetical protein
MFYKNTKYIKIDEANLTYLIAYMHGTPPSTHAWRGRRKLPTTWGTGYD